MGPHYLDRLFAARSIAVIGASERPGSIGQRVFANLLEAGFSGELYPVNLRHDTVQGRPAHARLAAIGRPVDVAVITTPAAGVPALVRECGEQGVRLALVMSAGFGEAGADGRALERAMVEEGRRHGVRIVGPNCLGAMRPRAGLNATFSNNRALPGRLALVSQSGALCTAILDWALSRQIGFSAVVSLGDAADVDFGDVLDYLALDPQTHGILLYLEGVTATRRFVSGLRVAARMKPVVAVKAGRQGRGTEAARSHTGALVGADDVFEAALRRAGVVRADTIEQLFSAARILSENPRIGGNRLAVVTNGGGPGVMAADRAAALGLELPPPSPATVEELDASLPPHWSRANPIDLRGDSGPRHYGAALAAVLRDRQFDAVLVILTPQAASAPHEAAAAVIEAARGSRRPVLACWMGGEQVESAWDAFDEARVLHFPSPEAAVEAFGYLAAHRRNRQLLLQVAGPLAAQAPPDVGAARAIIERALDAGRDQLSQVESKGVLRAFGIPVNESVLTRSTDEAVAAAESAGLPVAMKISSPDVLHKSDVDGVRLDVESAEAVRATWRDLVEGVRARRPGAAIDGVTVEPMHGDPHGRELLVGVVRDAVFGPVLSFGAGGIAVEVLRDRTVELPPLNSFIAAGMIERTRIARLLGEFRQMPPVDRDALEAALLRVSEMVCELPHLQEMDINPLVAGPAGVLALDARITVARPSAGGRYAELAIHPYPAHLETPLQLKDGTAVTIRPIRPEDAEMVQSFVRGLSEESSYFRFMQSLQELTPTMLVRFTQIDYDREMALIAVTGQDGAETEIGVARYVTNPDGTSCEFALVIADAWQGRGLGTRLMQRLMEVARECGLQTIEGEVLADNAGMLQLMDRLGFSSRTDPEDHSIKRVSRAL
ncbi:MAG: bifunctional acetate--CoA ligase family protein/GNAT family N-acetyltransferase [Halofilum sp. (in: g-proteobacteria)]|nr:bifunctional acetate--CoA ligase family protein/GNAT family N-acetyltransferase [Halofilum sp. (in: g-proteobacteria)]